jgi:hypothetical protein
MNSNMGKPTNPIKTIAVKESSGGSPLIAVGEIVVGIVVEVVVLCLQILEMHSI